MIAYIPEGLHLWEITIDRAEDLWRRVKDFDRLFSDETRGDKEAFMRRLFDRRTIVLETDDFKGILVLSAISDGHKAEVHAIFFDHKLSPRTDLVRRALAWAFAEFDLKRIGASVPRLSVALRRWMRKLGFYEEGFVRNDFHYKGRAADSVLMRIERGRVLDGVW